MSDLHLETAGPKPCIALDQLGWYLSSSIRAVIAGHLDGLENGERKTFKEQTWKGKLETMRGVISSEIHQQSGDMTRLAVEFVTVRSLELAAHTAKFIIAGRQPELEVYSARAALYGVETERHVLRHLDRFGREVFPGRYSGLQNIDILDNGLPQVIPLPSAGSNLFVARIDETDVHVKTVAPDVAAYVLTKTVHA